MSSARAIAVQLPDDPEWIDIRGMLLSDHAEVIGASVESGFVVRVKHGAVSTVGVVGAPDVLAIREAVSDVTAMTPVVCQQADAAHVRRALVGWSEEPAIVHTLPKGAELKPRVPTPPPSESVRLLAPDEGAKLAHLPPPLRHEMTAALGMGPLAVAFVDDRAASFCYPVWRTEAWWDVSIDTLEAYRRRGLAVATVRLMTAEMRKSGRAPVWSALASNTPSLRLAAKLGFAPAGGIMVFSRDGRWTLLSGGYKEAGEPTGASGQ